MKKVVVTEILGGLGNQMFQYAVGRALSEKNGNDFKLCVEYFQTYSLRKYDLHHYRVQEDFAPLELIKKFGVQDRFLKKEEIKPTIWKKISNRLLPQSTPRINPEYRELKEKKDFVFDPEVLKATGNCYLSGYWQSPKYFDFMAETIRNEFQLKEAPTGKNRELIDFLEKKNFVAMHIRRGDYVTNPSAASFHGSCSLEYYQTAAQKMMESVGPDGFIVFSDDIEWCRENIQLPKEVLYMDHNPPEKGHEDIRLMQHCQAHIIANSSFSWWGAWLAGNRSRKVIAPKQWTAKHAYGEIDIYPDHWDVL